MRYRKLRFPQGKAKAVTLSYDDCCRQNIKFAEIITNHRFKCTFNLNSYYLGDEPSGNSITKQEVADFILNNGHEVAVHGAQHIANGLVRPIDGIQDVLNCRLGLEKDFDCIIRGMAYPDSGIRLFHNGATYENIKHYLTDLDIVYSRTLGADNDSFELPTDWHSWMPTAHHNNKNLFEWIDKFLNLNVNEGYIARRTPKLFYLWGHAYEFDNNNNWNRLEEICQKLGGKEDIWYATNIEIYDYVNAYNSLVFSADSSIVYNPSLITVWFDADGKLYSVKSGETLKIN